MNTETACHLISHITYKPGWQLKAETCDRFEDGVTLHIEYVAPNYNREYAPEYLEKVSAGARFIIMVSPDMTPNMLYHQVFHYIMECEQHEAREAFRVGPQFDAPYHPHTHAGMESWGDKHRDLTFGLA